jgi:FHA domain
MIKCSECGYENMDGLDYCDGCGAKLEPATAAASPSGAPANASNASPAMGTEAGGTGAAAEPGAIEETAAAGAPAETGSEGSASAAQPVADEHAPAKAPTGEMNAGATPAAGAELLLKAKLAIIRGGRRGQEFELEPGNNLVGRWDPETGSFPEVDLDADDPEAKISRKHALIRLDASRITIEDIGSLNGTYVNRQPRLQPGTPVDLKDGDEIIIGKTFLKLSINPIS